MTREPLFILCPGRSFSSVVCAVIGQHPEMFGLPEVNLFVKETLGDLLDVASPVLGIQGALSGLLRTVAELKFGVQTVDTVDQAQAWLDDNRAMTGAEVFRALSEMAGGRLLVDKTPTNSRPDALVRIARAFPDARYLHLSRHPYATCRSKFKAYSKQKRRRGELPETLENHWYERHASLLEFGRQIGPGQYMFLQGEWFFEDPVPVLEQVCEWLGVSADPDAVAAMLKPELSPFAVLGPDNARFGNNPGFIENPTLRIGAVKPEILSRPMEWIEDRQAYFTDQTRCVAAMMGYDR